MALPSSAVLGQIATDNVGREHQCIDAGPPTVWAAVFSAGPGVRVVELQDGVNYVPPPGLRHAVFVGKGPGQAGELTVRSFSPEELGANAAVNIGTEADGTDTTFTPAGTGAAAIAAAGLRTVTGSYTGDGTTSQAITGVGFQPKFVKIWQRETTETGIGYVETTDTIIDDAVGGMAVVLNSTPVHVTRDNYIASLDADGFTVDDNGTNSLPNASGVVYNFLAIG